MSDPEWEGVWQEWVWDAGPGCFVNESRKQKANAMHTLRYIRTAGLEQGREYPVNHI